MLNATKRLAMAVTIAACLGGCGSEELSVPQDQCAWPDNTRLVFEGCGGAAISGTRCAVGCGYEPLSAGGHVSIAQTGCVIYPKTTDEHVCVASCAECQ